MTSSVKFQFIIGIHLFVLAAKVFAKDYCSENVTITTHVSTYIIDGVPYEKTFVNHDRHLSMHFEIPGIANARKIKWRLNNGPIDVDNDEKPPVHFLFDQRAASTNVTLVIERPKQHYIGEWIMKAELEDDSNVEQSCFLFSPVLVYRFDETLRTIEGKALKEVCRSAGLPTPKKMQWYRAIVKEDGQITLEMIDSGGRMEVIEGDTLYIENAQLSDAGIYICNATGSTSEDSAAAILKVKSRLAPLWPFIGILVEVMILAVTILVYERRRSIKKKKAAESDPLLTATVTASGDTQSKTK